MAPATAEEAVDGAEIICTVTSSRTAVLHGRWLPPGTHINVVGAPRPDWRQMDTDAVAEARLSSTHAPRQSSRRATSVGPIAEGAFTPAHIQAEIGEVFGGRHPGRQDAGQITLFKSLGLAIEDVATAQLAYERARDRRIGEPFVLD